jgi:phosphonate transport system substrate-binding protein
MFVAREIRNCAIACTIVSLLCTVIPIARVIGQTPSDIETKTLTLGIVAEIDQQQVAEHFRGFIRYVAGKISSTGTIEGTVFVAQTPAQLADLLRQKKVDFYMESPYPTYIINSVHGAGRLLLRRWKRGASEYQSLIFTKAGGEAKRLEDLRGRIISFEDPGSTSGHFLPKFFLSRLGFKLSQKSGTDSPVSAGEVGYVFTYSQEKLVDLVLTKQAAAGAFSSDDYAAICRRSLPVVWSRFCSRCMKIPKAV